MGQSLLHENGGPFNLLSLSGFCIAAVCLSVCGKSNSSFIRDAKVGWGDGGGLGYQETETNPRIGSRKCLRVRPGPCYFAC